MLIGYAHVSTPDQKLDLQRDELKRAGCRKLFTDVVGGAKTDLELGRGSLVHEFHGEVIGCQCRRIGQGGAPLPSPFTCFCEGRTAYRKLPVRQAKLGEGGSNE